LENKGRKRRTAREREEKKEYRKKIEKKREREKKMGIPQTNFNLKVAKWHEEQEAVNGNLHVLNFWLSKNRRHIFLSEKLLP